ncbi:Cleavage and polyadenylation specificity factor subunit 3 [Phlyctochytrium planicorne]|nr:Cleavage and polyadenylation specificity factor subunit 3 [Phlyctochytrium planicorne]
MHAPASIPDLLRSSFDDPNAYVLQPCSNQDESDVLKITPLGAGQKAGRSCILLEYKNKTAMVSLVSPDRHLMAAERPPNVVPEVLITESTYSVQHHRPRNEREHIFTTTVHQVVEARELLLILDEYWQAYPELQNVPSYYVSSLAKKCMAVYQTFSNLMNARIRQQAKISNPFQFKHISNLKSISHFDDVGPCLMMASPGMLQFIQEVGSTNLVLVHGDQNEMGRLKSALASRYAEKDEQLHIYTPKELPND